MKDNKIKIEITEGCVSYSYMINGIEWADLTEPTSPHYTIRNGNIVANVFYKLYEEICLQYNIPHFLTNYMWDNENDDWEAVPCTQDTFIEMVKANKKTEIECLGKCYECGDTIYKYNLWLKIEE